jgi:hypothetical protein
VVKGAVVVVAEEDKVVDEVKVAVRTVDDLVEALALAEILAPAVVLIQLPALVSAPSYDSPFLPRLE